MFAKKAQKLLNIASTKDAYTGQRAFSQIHAKMCFYEVLGVTSKATAHEIKKAYYNKVKKYHPDHNKEATAEEHFKIVAKAYETLKNPEARQVYDSNKRNPGFTPGQDSNRNARANYTSSSSSTSYTGRYQNPGSTEGDEGYYGAWRSANAQRYYDEAAKRNWHHTYQSSSANSSLNSVITRVSVVVILFVLIDLWRKQQDKNVKKPSQPQYIQNPIIQAGNGVMMNTQSEDHINREMYRKEMEQKNFRIEHQKLVVRVSPEALEAQKTYKKEKKIVDIEDFMAKKNIQLVKSEDPFAQVR